MTWLPWLYLVLGALAFIALALRLFGPVHDS